MTTETMDPTFYRSAREAAEAPREGLAYVVAFDRDGLAPDAMSVVDVDPNSADYGRVVGWTDVPPARSCTTSAGTPARAR